MIVTVAAKTRMIIAIFLGRANIARHQVSGTVFFPGLSVDDSIFWENALEGALQLQSRYPARVLHLLASDDLSD